MSKKISRQWSILFIGIILIIPISFIILKPYINSENYENRELTSFPTASTTEWYKFPEAIDDFVTDNFPYKNQLVLVNSLVNKDLFNDNPSTNTINGKEGWIFFKGEYGQALSQYKGTMTFTDEELERINENLQATRQYLADRGCDFLLLIAPNKERMYSEYMPNNIKVISSTCNTDQLVDYLSENTDLKVVWTYEDLLKYKQNNPNEPLYYHLDTHWNNLGAYIGTKAMCDNLKVSFVETDFSEINESSYDLANQAGLRIVLDGKDIDYEPVNYSDDYEIEVDDIDGCFIYHNTGKDDNRIMICRDSFTIGMRRYIGNTFNESYMVHRNIFENSMVDEFNPDIFVYEVCEREITKLLDFRLE